MSPRARRPLQRRQRSQLNGRAKDAFTVVEVLVALVVVTVGLLGVAGASATALRASNAALREQAAVARARNRLARLHGAGCTVASDGVDPLSAGLVDRWTVAPAINRVRLVEVRTEWDDVGRRATVLLRSALLC